MEEKKETATRHAGHARSFGQREETHEEEPLQTRPKRFKAEALHRWPDPTGFPTLESCSGSLPEWISAVVLFLGDVVAYRSEWEPFCATSESQRQQCQLWEDRIQAMMNQTIEQIAQWKAYRTLFDKYLTPIAIHYDSVTLGRIVDLPSRCSVHPELLQQLIDSYAYKHLEELALLAVQDERDDRVTRSPKEVPALWTSVRFCLPVRRPCQPSAESVWHTLRVLHHSHNLPCQIHEATLSDLFRYVFHFLFPALLSEEPDSSLEPNSNYVHRKRAQSHFEVLFTVTNTDQPLEELLSVMSTDADRKRFCKRILDLFPILHRSELMAHLVASAPASVKDQTAHLERIRAKAQQFVAAQKQKT